MAEETRDVLAQVEMADSWKVLSGVISDISRR